MLAGVHLHRAKLIGWARNDVGALRNGGVMLNVANDVTTCGTTILAHKLVGGNTRIRVIVAPTKGRFVAPVALSTLADGPIVDRFFSRHSNA